jgi:hypothetical protein
MSKANATACVVKLLLSGACASRPAAQVEARRRTFDFGPTGGGVSRRGEQQLELESTLTEQL